MKATLTPSVPVLRTVTIEMNEVEAARIRDWLFWNEGYSVAHPMRPLLSALQQLAFMSDISEAAHTYNEIHRPSLREQL